MCSEDAVAGPAGSAASSGGGGGGWCAGRRTTLRLRRCEACNTCCCAAYISCVFHGAPLQGAARCLRSALGLLVGESGCDGGGCSCNDGSGGAQHPPQQHSVLDVLGYAHTAWVGFSDTCRTAFHGKSPLTAAALLDLTAVLCVWRRHKAAHAEAAAAAAVRRAAADPADAATVEVPAPRRADLALLQSAAAHAKAAYGAPAASGDVSSAWGYLSLITVGQAT